MNYRKQPSISSSEYSKKTLCGFSISGLTLIQFNLGIVFYIKVDHAGLFLLSH